ncbi:hypothetical protein ACP2AV_02735 [Aliiroseovarius sp. PTFE2010]|uniref:hypothetical protein n=1 Tax=Aliiroseovarius sp. PTFE2010 TaxID=3417190 RepID=UPI003CE84DDA
METITSTQIFEGLSFCVTAIGTCGLVAATLIAWKGLDDWRRQRDNQILAEKTRTYALFVAEQSKAFTEYCDTGDLTGDRHHDYFAAFNQLLLYANEEVLKSAFSFAEIEKTFGELRFDLKSAGGEKTEAEKNELRILSQEAHQAEIEMLVAMRKEISPEDVDHRATIVALFGEEYEGHQK